MSSPAGRVPLRLGILTPHLRPHRGLAATTMSMIVVMVALDLAGPILLARSIDAAVESAGSDRIVELAIWFLGVAVGAQVLSATTTYLGARIGWTIANDLRLVAGRHLTSLDLDYHTSTNPGTLIERVDGDITAIAEFFSNFAVRVTSTTLLLGGIVALTFAEHPLAGWMTLGFTVIVMGMLFATRSLGVAASESERGLSARLYGFIEERLAALDDIRANGAGAQVMRRFKAIMADWFLGSRRAWMRRSIIWVTIIGSFSAGSLIALTLGTRLVGQGAMTIGTAYLIFQYMAKLEAPIEEITNQMQELQKAAAGTRRLSEILALTPSVDRSGTTPLPRGALSLAFEGVDFSYDDGVPVLSGIDLDIPAGTHLGLLGRTGGGKSTMTKLIARFHDPSAGTVRLDGIDLRTADPASVRRAISFITQDVQLFDGTVKQNVTFFDPIVADEDVEDALASIGLADWAHALPDGIHTELGTNGIGISSGEAQLVALARAHLRDPGLIILDEPSSRIDPATEALLTKALARLTEGRTSIVIAHRLATVANVDRVAILERGALVESGNRAALAADPSSRLSGMLAAAHDGLLVEGSTA
ncbi:MAG: ABC transporter ATP-binding protein [Acidimicrobiia bacterium]|nr:MAG: ABC transporter ATP-binding protein [Acidimicrobiia bacterium]